ncbi:plasmid mobilization protein [Azospirillum melinis]|uniref:plasmid mobilization protein n=1 Tax=Azospirillum melinis TaxID=328839 RepID=UPI003757CEBB
MPPGTREPRDVVISYRVTAAEAAHIDAAAAKMTPARTRQDWCRAAALHAARIKVPKPPPPRRNPARRLPKADIRALAAVLAQLGKVGSNLNQMARRTNATGRLPEGPGLREALDEVTAAAGHVRAALEGHGEDDDHQRQ